MLKHLALFSNRLKGDIVKRELHRQNNHEYLEQSRDGKITTECTLALLKLNSCRYIL